LYEFLKNNSDTMSKIIVSTSIFAINQDNDMVDIAITSFKNLENTKDSYYVYKLITAFYYLIKFNKPEVNEIIKEYLNHKEYLLSYNAKRALGNH